MEVAIAFLVADTPVSDPVIAGELGPRQLTPVRSRRNWSKAREAHRSQRQLGAVPVFAGSTRAQIARITRWGDVVHAHRGDVLLHEDRPDYWFFVVLTGSVRATKAGQPVGSAGRGDHFGEVGIVGFRPQGLTWTATEPTVLFVLGRRYLLSLAATDPTVQRALFPTVTPGTYRDFADRLRAEGRADWERARVREVARPGPGPAAQSRPGRHLTWSQALALLSHHDTVDSESVHQADLLAPSPLSAGAKRSIRLTIVAVAVALIAGVGLLYHPPVAVVSAHPVDVSGDITVIGADTGTLTGPYLMTVVTVERPSLVGALGAWVKGRSLVSVSSLGPAPSDLGAARSRGHQAFKASRDEAAALAIYALGLDKGVRVVIRDRHITGASGGLIYALAILDMLDPYDLAAGRVVVATGQLGPDGTVVPVGFLSAKARAAEAAGAGIFLVPATQAHALDDAHVRGVTSLDDAVRILREGG